MSNEITVTGQLQIRKGNGQFISNPTSLRANMDSTFNGPTPGAVTAQLNHTIVTFSQLDAMGGWCNFVNTDSTNFVTVGVYDPSTGFFLPLFEMLPGEFINARLSRYLSKEMEGTTGTGTVGSGFYLAVKSDIAPAVVQINGFNP